MKRLILFRHAKSAWDDDDLPDHDRPLNDRGRRAAPVMGAWLAERGFRPDHVICSSSLRTRLTWALAATALPEAPAPTIEPRLYHASPATMLALARGAPDAARTVAMIGHQPGLSAFARKLSGAEVPAASARAFTNFPTAGVAAIDFDLPRWAELDWGGGDFHAFAIPRELV